MVDCEAKMSYINFTSNHILSCIHIILCLIALIINLIFLRFFWRDIRCHVNCKILLLSIIVVNIFHAIAYATIQLTHIIKLITSVNPCDIDFDVTFCFICRFITTTCTYSHTTVLFGLLLERVIATKFAATYEKTSIIIGFGIVVTAISVATLLSYAKIHKFFLNKSMIYCSSLTFSTHLDNIAVHATLLSMLLVTIVVFAIIFIQNRNLRKRITRSINEKYQASENLRILRLMGPVLMLHFIAYPTYFAVTLIMQIVKNFIESEKFRLIYSACYFPSLYCSLSVSILWYSIIQTKKHEEKDNAVFHRTAPQQENNIYFQNYTAMWN